MKRLEGRVAIVTGAASGIGKATAERLAEEGAAVLVTDIQVEAGEAAVKAINQTGGKAEFIEHDVTASNSGRPPARGPSRYSAVSTSSSTTLAWVTSSPLGRPPSRSGTAPSPSTRPACSSA